MKYNTILILIVVLISCSKKEQKTVPVVDLNAEEEVIQLVLNNWHKDAAEANFEPYFNAMANTSVFIGTDAYENWNLEAFKSFSKPYFDKGKAWDFTSIDRNVYVDTEGKIAWFDELLETWMGVCRGSGVLRKNNNSWKIEQYVLSLTISNENIEAVIDLNSKLDSVFLKKYKN
ncbi:nuclear transport factor 2 family protein [Lutibacter sp. A80]|uniref:nuclear transport factor 2 family protein n=1 Tax=Lutibacter sp. A80 TaxID=2918453 RepID=UPI001F05BD4F|nr:nuclear transport factor 2 family protein [Lutibacter sp. A80]UMB59971.1 nuclear transport factor 2 family protein [Lutibacter sp. A80]